MIANRFIQPINYYGTYKTNSWAGYVFKEPLGYTTGAHTGVDYNGAGSGNADLGMEIRSIADGIVRFVGNRTDIGFGNTTIIEYPLAPTYKNELGCDSLFARYMHQNTIEVSVGQEVSIGQRIGTVGNTGTEYAHLHLDLYKSTIDGGGVHFRYDKNTQLSSYLDTFEFIASHSDPVDSQNLLGYQREVSNPDGVNGRSAPNTSATILKEYKKGEILDFKGFVRGQDPYGKGNNIWLVGRYSDSYWYSGSFKDPDTHDLADLSSVVPPEVPVVPVNPVYPIPTTDPLMTSVVNKKHPLVPIDYIPNDLVDAGNGQNLRTEAQEAFKLMSNTATREGVNLIPTSGYRSYITQKSVYDGYVHTDGQEKADTYSARPGYSEHQTGLTMDITGSGIGLDEAFETTKEFTWLKANAYKYGFILRYPKGKSSITGYTYEPWHWRYVGVTVAAEVYNRDGETLEEYFKIEGGDYPAPVDPTDPIIPTKPSDIDKENNELLKKILELLTSLVEKIKSIFK